MSLKNKITLCGDKACMICKVDNLTFLLEQNSVIEELF